MIDKEGLEDLPAHLRSQVQLHTSNSNAYCNRDLYFNYVI